MRTTFLTLAVAIVAATQAFAADPQQPVTAQPISATTDKDGDKVICHHLAHEGSLTPIVQCQTERGWERTRLLTHQAISDMQNQALHIRGR